MIYYKVVHKIPNIYIHVYISRGQDRFRFRFKKAVFLVHRQTIKGNISYMMKTIRK